MEMEVDSGAGISVIPEQLLSKKFKKCNMEPTLVCLRTYDGKIIVPVSQIHTKKEYNGKTVPSRLVVIDSGNRPLFGRDLMKAFSLNITESNSEINTLKVEADGLKKLLKNYSELFEEGLGCYKYEKN